MNKKFLEKDGFYLALFACVCVVALGGVMFTKNNVDKLASEQNLTANKDDEIHLIDNEENKDDKVQTSTESEENLEKAKEDKAEQKEAQPQSVSKDSFMGNKIINKHDDIYESKTLDVWQVHKGIDVSMTKDQDVKSLLDGKVVDVYNDDEFGMSVKIESEEGTMVYSNLSEEVKVKTGNDIKSGQVIGKVGSTSINEVSDGIHIHIQAYNGDEEIDPMSLVK